jgi:hypothetical protein
MLPCAPLKSKRLSKSHWTLTVNKLCVTACQKFLFVEERKKINQNWLRETVVIFNRITILSLKYCPRMLYVPLIPFLLILSLPKPVRMNLYEPCENLQLNHQNYFVVPRNPLIIIKIWSAMADTLEWIIFCLIVHRDIKINDRIWRCISFLLSFLSLPFSHSLVWQYFLNKSDSPPIFMAWCFIN